MKSKNCPFTHPQIERKYANEQSKKLCNDATEQSMSSNTPTSSSSGGSDDDFTVAQPVPMA
jgi:hypothetical protein